MSHLSIAIIKRELYSKNDDEPTFEYLVEVRNDGSLKFIDKTDKAINGRFDYSKFKEYIKEYLDLIELYNNPEEVEEVEEEIDFIRIDRFKSSKREPRATAYQYLLSKSQAEFINNKIENAQGKWSNLKWVSEDEFHVKDEDWKSDQKFLFNKEKPFKQVNFSNDVRVRLRNIVDAKEKGKLVIFAGAGISIDSGVPSWSELVKALSNDLDTKESDELKVAQSYFNKYGKKEYIQKVRKELNIGSTVYNSLHTKIVEIEPHHIITTNFDNHFEQVLSKNSYKYSIIKKDSDLPYTEGNPMFIKMHGDFSNNNIILKEDDYKLYSSNFPLIEGYLKGIFASKLILFIGFSYKDPNLVAILDSVKDILKDDNQKPYLLHVPGLDAAEGNDYRKKIESKGVTVVEYEKNAIEEYFDQVSTEVDKIRTEELSIKGNQTYKFLRIIEKFDIYSDSLDDFEIENQLINSLLRYIELGAIPTKIIEKIPPFKLKQESNFESETNAKYSKQFPFHLETLNSELIDYLKSKANNDNINKRNYNVEFLYYRDETISINEQRLNSALQLLYKSGIHCIIRKNDPSSSVHLKLVPISKTEKCNCLRCLYTRNEFAELLKKIKSNSLKHICDEVPQQDTLSEAFGCMKSGKMALAYYILKKLMDNAWRSQEFIKYFIAQYNLTLLKPFMNATCDGSITSEEHEIIRLELNEINLDKSIYELPVEPVVKEALIFIKENRVLETSRKEIDNNLEKIKEQYKKYRGGSYRSMGPNYALKLEVAFSQLWNYYYFNFLFNDSYSEFEMIAIKYVGGMIASFMTSDTYEQKVDRFSPFFRQMFLQYCDPSDNKQLIDGYELKNFVFDQHGKEKKETLNLFINFCKSGFNEKTFFQGVSENKLYSNAISNSLYFESNLRKMFNNYLLLLTYMELSEEEVAQIFENCLNYLENNNLLSAYRAHHYFLLFCRKYISYLDEATTNRLLYYIISDGVWSDYLIAPICNSIITGQGREEFLGKEFYTKLLRRIERRNKYSIDILSIIPFYPLLKHEQKEELMSELEPELYDNQFIRETYDWGVWSIPENEKYLLKFVDNILSVCNKFPDYYIKDNGLPKDIENFDVWNDLQFLVYLIYDNKLFNHYIVDQVYSNINSNRLKWILKPKSYNYSEFDVRWLLTFKNRTFTNHLREIGDLKIAISKGLKNNFNSEIARIYHEQLS